MSVQTKKTAYGGCPHDCPDTCGIISYVKDGKLVKVKGDPAAATATRQRRTDWQIWAEDPLTILI